MRLGEARVCSGSDWRCRRCSEVAISNVDLTVALRAPVLPLGGPAVKAVVLFRSPPGRSQETAGLREVPKPTRRLLSYIRGGDLDLVDLPAVREGALGPRGGQNIVAKHRKRGTGKPASPVLAVLNCPVRLRERHSGYARVSPFAGHAGPCTPRRAAGDHRCPAALRDLDGVDGLLGLREPARSLRYTAAYEERAHHVGPMKNRQAHNVWAR